MSDEFDPYLRWLGIRDPQRPPNHYRLLGLELFESDPDVIATAADRQMLHVRSYQTGKHSVDSQKLLNELAAAKICLLNARKKAEYDARLRGEGVRAKAPVPPPILGPVPPPLPPSGSEMEPPPLPPSPMKPRPLVAPAGPEAEQSSLLVPSSAQFPPVTPVAEGLQVTTQESEPPVLEAQLHPEQSPPTARVDDGYAPPSPPESAPILVPGIFGEDGAAEPRPPAAAPARPERKDQQADHRPKDVPKRRVLPIVGLILVLLALGAAAYFGPTWFHARHRPQTETALPSGAGKAKRENVPPAKQSIDQARQLIRDHRFPQARESLALAADARDADAHGPEIRRLTTLVGYLEQFQAALLRALPEFKPKDGLSLSSGPATVVQNRPEELVIRTAQQNTVSYRLVSRSADLVLPADVAVAIADRRLTDGRTRILCQAAWVIFHPVGDRQYALRLCLQARNQGLPVAELIDELESRGVPVPKGVAKP
jgi:hypothetical protein